MSIIRMGTIIAIIGVLAVVIGVVSFFIDQSSYKVPLEIEPYPGAEVRGQRPVTNTRREVFYVIGNADPTVVADYYQQRLDSHYGNSPTNTEREQCVRVPAEGEFDTTNTVGVAPYQFVCMFDRAGFNGSLQQTRIVIQPGLPNEDPVLDTEGLTVVAYEQSWQP